MSTADPRLCFFLFPPLSPCNPIHRGVQSVSSCYCCRFYAFHGIRRPDQPAASGYQQQLLSPSSPAPMQSSQPLPDLIPSLLGHTGRVCDALGARTTLTVPPHLHTGAMLPLGFHGRKEGCRTCCRSSQNGSVLRRGNDWRRNSRKRKPSCVDASEQSFGDADEFSTQPY